MVTHTRYPFISLLLFPNTKSRKRWPEREREREREGQIDRESEREREIAIVDITLVVYDVFGEYTTMATLTPL